MGDHLLIFRPTATPPFRTGLRVNTSPKDWLECIQFLEQPSAKPFFLCWWNYSVHYPIQAPQELIEKYEQRPGVSRPAYHAMIEGMDQAIGKVINHLESSGLSSNTLVVFTSDNGSLFENLPLRENKGHLYEGGIRVPWIMRWPGKIKPAQTLSLIHI